MKFKVLMNKFIFVLSSLTKNKGRKYHMCFKYAQFYNKRSENIFYLDLAM